MADAIIRFQDGLETRVTDLTLIRYFPKQGVPKEYDSSKWDNILLDSGRCLFVGNKENLFTRLENTIFVKIEK